MVRIFRWSGSLLLGGVLALGGATISPPNAEGCAGSGDEPDWEDPGQSGQGGSPPAAPTCEKLALTNLSLPFAVVPESPGSVPLDVAVVCSLPENGVGLGIAAFLEILVQDADGKQIATAQEPLYVKAKGPAGVGYRTQWSYPGKLAPGIYTLSAHIGDGEPRTVQFEVPSVFSPEVGALLQQTLVEEGAGTQECCQPHCENGYSCINHEVATSASFQVSWKTNPWITTTISWDGGAPQNFPWGSVSSKEKIFKSPGKHCVQVITSEVVSGAVLLDETLCESPCFKPLRPVECQPFSYWLAYCWYPSEEHEKLKEQICAKPPQEPPTCEEGAGGQAGGGSSGGQTPEGGSGGQAGDGGSGGQSPKGGSGGQAGQPGGVAGSPDAEALAGGAGQPATGGAEPNAGEGSPQHPSSEASSGGCQTSGGRGGGGWFLALCCVLFRTARRTAPKK
jgi:hypothetical protein